MEFINKFKDYLLNPKASGLSRKDASSQATVKNYIADIRHFVLWFETAYKKTFSPSEITIQTVQEFRTSKKATLSESSLDRHVSSLRKFFLFLKLNGDIASSPFDQIVPQAPKEDPWHLKDFKDYLYVSDASRLTIKNYVIDVKQFLSWAEEVLGVKDAWHIADKNVLGRIDNKLVEEYKQRLLHQNVFSASSINRKLSSLRKYLSWAAEQGYMGQGVVANDQVANVSKLENISGVARLRSPQNFSGLNNVKEASFEEAEGTELACLTSAKKRQDPAMRSEMTPISGDDRVAGPQQNTAQAQNLANPAQSHPHYSKIPPIRLFQKLTNAGTLAFDLLIVSPITHGFKKTQHHAWVLKGRPLFVPSAHMLAKKVKRFSPKVRNVSKELYAPLSISTKDFPWYKKVLFHVRYTRPQWYHSYHRLPIAHYFNWAVLIIFSAGIGFGMYNSFFQKPNPSLAALPTAGTRVLSFQGRLTDANDNPITTASWIRFIIYNDQTASGSARQWEEVQKVTPDQDGIFSLYLGSNGSGGTAAACNSGNPPTSPATGACGIPQSLFANNSALWLGVTVEDKAELTPREQIATVAYAVNSETLQGLPPITQSGAGTQNVVLALNSSGNLAIGGSTTFQATSGDFTLSGNTLVLNTNAGTNGNITLSPDGIGAIDLQKPLQNSTNNNNIASAQGAVEIDDLAAILATSSGQSALTIDQNGTGPIISASHSGTAEFTLDSSGNGTFNGNVTGQTIYTGGGASYYINNAISNLNSLTLAANLSVSGNVSSDLTPSATDTYSLGTSSNEWLNLYAKNIYSGGQLLSQLLQRNAGVLSPLNITDDFAVGGTSTSSAKFQVFGNTGNATTSGNLTFNTTGSIQTTKNQSLTLGGTSTGNISLSPQNGSGTIFANGNIVGTGTLTGLTGLTSSGTITFSGLSTGILHSTGGTISSSAVDLSSSDVTNNLPLSKGGTGANLTGDAGGLVYYSSSTALATLNHGTSGYCLTSGGTGAPTWQSCASAVGSAGNFWTLNNNGTIYPINTTLDLLVGGTATSSAKFAVTGIDTNTPTASVSATSGTGVAIKGDGSIQSLKNGTLTIGGNTTGNIVLAPLNSSGTVTIQGSALDTTTSTFSLLTSAGTLTIGGTGSTTTFNSSTIDSAASTLALFATPTTLNIGGSSTTTNLKGNTTIGTDATNTVTINGLVNQSVLPSSSSINIGDPTHYWGTIYATNIISPVGGGTSGFWQLANNVLAPVNSWDDLAVGGNATGSATPFQVFATTVGVRTAGTASTSGNLTFTGTSSQINLLNATGLTVKSSAGGDEGLGTIFTLANNGDLTLTGNAAVNGGSITTTSTTANIFTSNAATINFGRSGSLSNLQGSLTLGSSISNTVSVNGLINTALLPTGTPNLGSASNLWGTLYATNINLPVSGGTDGYWTLTSNVLSPTNNWNDLTVGGTATGSAKFQIFANAYTNDAGTVPAGTASTSGNLTFTGTSSTINLLNGTALNIKRSAGGNIGLSTVATFGSDGNITATGNLAVNGSQLTSTTGTFSLLNTGVTNLSFAGAATTLSIGNSGGTATFNGALTSSGTFTASGNSVLGASSSQTVNVNGRFISSLIPNAADTYNLGSLSNEWDTLYVRQIVSPSSGGLAGFWQLSNQGVLAPANLSNDLVIGGTATSSAVFQVFGSGTNAGSATMSGNLTLHGSNPTIGTTSQQTITIGNSTTGGIALNPNGSTGLFVNNAGSVGIGTAAPNSSLQIGANSGSLYVGDSTNTSVYASFNGRAFTGYDGSYATLQGASGHGIKFNVNNSTFGSGTVMTILSTGEVGIGTTSPLASSGLNVEKNSLGNTLALFNQLGNGDIISASSSGTQEFTVTSSGNIYGRKFTDIDNPIYYLDPAGLTVSASIAGSMTFTPASEHDVNFLNNSDLNFKSSPGGDAGLTSRLFIQGATGSVGIGTTVPRAELDVASSSASTEIIGSPYNPAIRISNTKGAAFNEKAELQFAVGGSINPTAAITALYTDWTSPGASQSLIGSDLAFSTKISTGTLTERMRIDKNGNVGIGTSSPDTALTLESVGDYSAGSNYTFDIDSGGTKMFNIGVNTSAAGSGGGAYINSLASRPLLLNASGSNNVGIGTSNPVGSFNLAINGATSALSSSTLANRGMVITANATGRDRLYFENTAATSGQRVFMIDNGNTSGILSFNSLNDAASAFTTQNILNLRYDGNVGIDTANPGRTLDVTGNWGGNEVDYTTANPGTNTITISGSGLVYHLEANKTSGNDSQTTQFNITGLPNTNGTFAYVALRASKTAIGASAQQVLSALRVNNSVNILGTTMDTGVGAGSANIWRQFVIMYINGNWTPFNTPTSTPNSSSFPYTADLAEWIEAQGAKPQAGELLTPGVGVAVKKSQKAYDQSAFGIVSTNPNTIYGEQTDTSVAMALAGRVPAIVTSLNGPIHSGDKITTSPLTGVGMKPLQPTQTVGKAMEDFDPSQTNCTQVSSYDSIPWPEDDGTNQNHPCFAVPVSSFDSATQTTLINDYHLQPNDNVYVGKVMTLVAQGYDDPQVYLTTTGDMHISDKQPSTDFNIPHYFTLNEALGQPITRMGAFLELAVGNLRAGSVNAQQVITNSLAITTANVTVAGQSLHDYIASVVNEVVSQNNQANSTQSNSVKTNLISPLSGDGIAIRLKDSKIEIAKDASSSAVASIDNNGNATFSGTLNSQNLAVNGDATVSGTLHADRIEANSITGLEAIVSTLSAQNVTIVNNIYNATLSATPTPGYIATGLDNSSSPSGSLLTNTDFTDIASFSGFLSYVPSLKATTGLFEQGLVSLGGTSLADTDITGQLTINSRLILADTSINVLGGDLQIQPLRQGGVNFLAGAVTIDTNGNLTVNGKAVFNGNLAVNTISPLAGNDFNVILNGSEGSKDSSTLSQNDKSPNFNIKNASNSAVFAVNQLGDVVASGAANISKLNFNLVQPALAVSDTEVVATGSAGTTAIKPHQKEITIDNPSVTSQSLIYITPVGTDQMPYLERQISGKSFTVGIPTPTLNAVNFNWLIVN